MKELYALKLRSKFEKDGDLRFISHLDLMRAIERAMRRAEIKFSLSKGFNPHPLLSFGSALMIGATTHGDYFDVVLEEEVDPEKFKNDMNRTLPKGLKIIDCYQVDDKDLLSDRISESEYIISVNTLIDEKDIKDIVERFIKRDEILIEKDTKRGKKIIDLKQYMVDLKILDICEDELTFYLRLKISEGSPSPIHVLKAIDNFGGHILDLERIRVDRKNLVLN